MSAELKKDGTLELTITREFSFSRELVFEAWTKKKHLQKWMGPTPQINLSLAEVDFKEGGTYRFGFEEKDCSDKTSYVHGKYLEITLPEKLVFTWVWEPPLEEANVETLVTVEFSETEKGTKVVLIHQRLMDEASCERHRSGWNGTLDKMANFLPNV
jgi:uncharacterized protein YndB with AHSA1/START domain